MFEQLTSAIVFCGFIIVTFILSYLGRIHSRLQNDDDLGGRTLNKWFIGLSAGATANSGFIVTGAVGLGYLYGTQWVMLPIAWFLGDLLFWKIFPQKINEFGHKTKCTTITELITSGLKGKWKVVLSIVSSTIIVIGLLGYTSAQWLAGQKFLNGAFGFDSHISLILFAVIITFYSSIGGFRGSVYTDTFQAVLRLIATIMIIGVCLGQVITNFDTFKPIFFGHSADYFIPFYEWSIFSVVGFMLGWAAASLGFGLGQPQILSRYLSGKNPVETKKAKWIYITYVQVTWISMTLFGMLLKGLIPELEDPEQGLSIFIGEYFPPIIVGVLIADIFGVIASTANSILISACISFKNDILQKKKLKTNSLGFTLIVISTGLITMLVSIWGSGNVFDLALKSVSLIGAGIAVPVVIKVLDIKHSEVSMLLAIVSGTVAAILWSLFGYSQFINEAFTGMFSGFIVNYFVYKLSRFSSLKGSEESYGNIK